MAIELTPPNATRSHPLLVVDWSVICYLNWFKMRTKDYIARSPLELEEYARNLCSYLLYLVERFEPEDLVLAVDAPENWRQGFYDDHYRQFSDFWKNLDDDSTWVVSFDKLFYRVHRDEPTQKWFIDKLRAADVDGMDLDNTDRWTHFAAGKTPDWIREAYPEAPATVQDHPDWEGLAMIVPRYKGNRATSRWDFDTPKAEWREYSRAAAFRLAPMFGGRAVMVDGAEGDDVCAVYLQDHREQDAVLVTIDSDLQQLATSCMFLNIWNPRHMDYAELVPDQIKFETLCKILGGDSADNIAGVSLKNKMPFSTVSWETDKARSPKAGKNTVAWLRKALEAAGTAGYGGVFDKLEKEADPETLSRNLTLVGLTNIPDQLYAAVSAAASYKAPDPFKQYPRAGTTVYHGQPLEDFLVSSRDYLATVQEAKVHREQDQRKGRLC